MSGELIAIVAVGVTLAGLIPHQPLLEPTERIGGML